MRLVGTVVAVVVLIALYVTWTANRLDRLHARVDAAWAALDSQLVRRAAAARELVARLPAGPEVDRLAAAASAALRGGPVNREAVENDLSRALRAVAPLLRAPAVPEGLRQELATATARVGFARSFHNAAVSNARAVRARRLVRALHLAGHRALPQHFDIDDSDPRTGPVSGPAEGSR